MPLKNKIIPLSLCLCLMGGVYIVLKHKHPTRYNAIPPVAAQDGIVLFTASSLDRIFQDGKTLLKPDFQKTASLSLAKNEYRSFQVVLQTRGRALNNVELEISDLINTKTGANINRKNISWRLVGYVRTLKPYYPVKYVGLWPDPLLPPRKISIKNNTTQPFWVTVYTPSETNAGDYKGNISIIVNHKTIQTMPLSVHVYNFALPTSSHLKTAFDFYGHLTKIRYLQGNNENDEAYNARISRLNDKYITFMLRYRMDPILNIDPSNQAELTKVKKYLAYGLSNFSIGKKGGTFENNWPSDDQSIESLSSLYRTYGEDLESSGLLKYSYIYLWDEGDMGNPQVAKIASMTHHAYPGLKNMVCYHGIWDTKDGLDWIKDIDIWTFQIDDFNEHKMRQLQSIGKEIWMYVSGPAGEDTPNLAMDFDSIDYRIIPWLCWKYDIKGFLYWCVNWWPLIDPFENARNSKWEQNGNGLLLYPGKDGPIASMRMELFREGMEDYEYLWLLSKHQKVTVDDSIASSMSKFTRDGAILNARRDAIAGQIEKFIN